jgi:hypothetical protein
MTVVMPVMAGNRADAPANHQAYGTGDHRSSHGARDGAFFGVVDSPSPCGRRKDCDSAGRDE